MPITKLVPQYTFTEDRLAQLKQVVPEAFADGKINWEALREILGEYLEDEDQPTERFGLFWPGKRLARRAAATPSEGTLVPAPGEGVDEDTTRNIFIEGENLEVLKLLRKAYAGKVKMIYIDPPYNTGNDFVYPDDYSEPVEAYLRRTGQTGEAGEMLTTNARTGGRFHSNWLNMMYPRLVLARDLLSDDGVIFVSIDDSESQHLRQILDELFGEENFQAVLFVQVRYPNKTLAERSDYQKLIEQVLVYSRNASLFAPRKPSEPYPLHKFKWKVTEKAPGTTLSLGGRQVTVFHQGEYDISSDTASLQGLKETWATGSILRANASGKFFSEHLAPRKSIDGLCCLYKVCGIGEDGLGYRYFTGPRRESATKGKFYSGIPLGRKQAIEEGRSTRKRPIANFMNMADSFGNCRHEGGVDFPGGKKPIAFLKALASLVPFGDTGQVVLDFFSGSSSTAHAVLNLNREDGGNRRFIMVQLPEPTQEGSTARNAGYDTIAEIGKERIRRVIARMRTEGEDQPGPKERETPEDLGFKVFKLARSNYKRWRNYEGESTAAVQDLFNQFESPLVEGWKPEDLLVEIMLQEGFPLDSAVTQQGTFFENRVDCVETAFCEHRLFVCLDKRIAQETVDALPTLLAEQDVFVCLDSALTDESKMRLDDRVNVHVI